MTEMTEDLIRKAMERSAAAFGGNDGTFSAAGFGFVFKTLAGLVKEGLDGNIVRAMLSGRKDVIQLHPGNAHFRIKGYGEPPFKTDDVVIGLRAHESGRDGYPEFLTPNRKYDVESCCHDDSCWSGWRVYVKNGMQLDAGYFRKQEDAELNQSKNDEHITATPEWLQKLGFKMDLTVHGDQAVTMGSMQLYLIGSNVLAKVAGMALFPITRREVQILCDLLGVELKEQK